MIPEAGKAYLTAFGVAEVTTVVAAEGSRPPRIVFTMSVHPDYWAALIESGQQGFIRQGPIHTGIRTFLDQLGDTP